MEEYNPKTIEKKWQREWEKKDVFKAVDKSKKPKYYLLVEFPYPSGAGLHVGHCRSYIALDIVARKKRMQGSNVLFPMGWDAFGLPAENYSIKTGIHPMTATKKNINNYRRQEKSLGLSFDWNREVDTTNPLYYKWTQWIFVQLFKNNLAYKAKIPINWCPACKIGLANEEVINNKCERCGKAVVQKEKEQWMLKITQYADRLLKDLNLVDYPTRVKASQEEWIGRSEGTEIKFKIPGSDLDIPVFTTRVDTLFGCTYVVLSPEHALVRKLKDKIRNYGEVERYLAKSREVKEVVKEKTGVELKGIKATNPVNNRKIPIFVADYVLTYGTGAIMAVPAHDQRDFDFARRYDLPIVDVVEERRRGPRLINSSRKAFEGEGVLVNSGRFTGMKSGQARERISQWLANRGVGGPTIHYKLRDWIFSRQRYWGEPIPMINCQQCGWVPVPKKDLPVELPMIKNFKPTAKGDSPLAKVKKWVNVKCPNCNGRAKRETDVMPNWAGSNWYYLRYCDPHNNKKLANNKLLEYWMPVDWYNGGMEHTTLHLLYSRFIFKFLWDIKAVPKSIGSEPYKKRTSHGMILGEGGIKMSKSKGNVVNPDDIIKKYGADTLRVYEMFIGPFEQTIPWDNKGVKGARKFLEKIWKLQYKLGDKIGDGRKTEKLVHQTIKKVGKDIENLKFNTAISSLMVLVNELEKKDEISLNYYSILLSLLSPFAPHLAEELWELVCFKGSCSDGSWPNYNPKIVKEEKVNLIIQINGKVRDRVEVEAKITEQEAKSFALKRDKIIKWINKADIKKTIFIKGRLINFVIDKK